MRASHARLSLFELVDRFRALLNEQPSSRSETEIADDCDLTETAILDFTTTSHVDAAMKLSVIADGLSGGLRSDGKDVGALREVTAWLFAAVNLQKQAVEAMADRPQLVGRA